MMKRLGISKERIDLMGKPHIGAYYLREDYRTNRLEEGARCTFCGKKATDSHHVVPRSTLHGWTVTTPLGLFVVMSPLFALCRQCHNDVHMRHYTIRWEWNDGAEKLWDNGHLLARVCRPGSKDLFDYGRYIIEDKRTGMEFVCDC